MHTATNSLLEIDRQKGNDNSKSEGNSHGKAQTEREKQPRGLLFFAMRAFWGNFLQLAEALGGLVGGDFAIADMDYAVGVVGDIRFVSNQHDCVALGLKFVEEGHDLYTGF